MSSLNHLPKSIIWHREVQNGGVGDSSDKNLRPQVGHVIGVGRLSRGFDDEGSLGFIGLLFVFGWLFWLAIWSDRFRSPFFADRF